MKSSNDLTEYARAMLFDADVSIWKQIWIILYEDAIYRLFRQLHIEAKEQDIETALSNYFIMHLANTGYLTNTTLGIMRLCDSRLKNVISLPVFLKGLRKFSSRGLIDGLTVRNWEQDYSAVPIMDLKTYRDKFLAHQANEVSRDRLGNDWSFDSRLIDVCEERIVKLTHRMSQTLLDDTNWPLIIEPSFAWGHIDLPLVPKVLKRRMHEIWNERERQMGEWVGVIRRRPD